MRNLDWTDEALCRQVDPELWFPETGHTSKAAKEICARCPVLQSCREWAAQTTAGELSVAQGVWGGMTERERRQQLKGAA
ncbi:WhiB family transcriptional regulator [Streptomyces rimosus]|uniref:WhiB family transcriptional regulator n=1 Tax=Streptomyces rimosus TaxID=1927 RepID=UPI0006B28172|nr:WhiB family transcriptional regulator [Streptomyces rimosus]